MRDLRGIVMDQDSNREEIKKKIEQAKRLSVDATDPTTVARLTQLILELEERLKEAR